MPENYRRFQTFHDKESHQFIDPVRKVDDIVDLTDELRFQVTTLNASTPTALSWPADCEIVMLRHVDATDIVWLGLTSGITAGGAGTFPLRPEDPPLRIRVKEGIQVYAITGTGAVDLHMMGYRKL